VDVVEPQADRVVLLERLNEGLVSRHRLEHEAPAAGAEDADVLARSPGDERPWGE